MVHLAVELFYFIKGILVALLLYVVYAVKFCLPNCLKCKKSIQGRICLVTGAGRGIGRNLAIRLAKENATVILWDRDIDSCKMTEETVHRVTGKLNRLYSYKCDIGNRNEVLRMANKVRKEVGPVDVLINNAGIVHGKTLLKLTPSEIHETIRTNLLSHYWTIQAFLPGMLDRDRGHIVAIASVAGVVGTTHLTDYCASKFGIRGLMEALDVELTQMKSHINLTTVCPYYTNTGLFQGVNTRFQFILPILEPDYVALRTVEAILTNQEVLYLPRAVYLLLGIKAFLPHKVVKHLGFLFGAHDAMQSFTGRNRGDEHIEEYQMEAMMV